jgi:hypothetical protein
MINLPEPPTSPEDLIIDNVVDQVLVLDSNPQIDDALIQRLKYDLATKTHNYEVIAKRYGLSGVPELFEYLRSHPAVTEDAKKLRALFQSDESIEARVRMRFLVATESLIAPMHNLVADPNTPTNARIDGFKQIQRGAGVDGVPAASRGEGGSPGGGTPFVLNINFKNGERTTISGTTVVDANEIPGPDDQATLPGLEEAEYDEDV